MTDDAAILAWIDGLPKGGEQPEQPPVADTDILKWVDKLPVNQSDEDLRKMILEGEEPMGWLATTAARTTPGMIARAINRATIGDSYIEPPEGDFGYFGNLASEITSFLVDPVLYAGASVGGRIATRALGNGGSLARAAGRSAIESGTALGTMTAVQNPAEQYVQTGEIDPLETVVETGKSALLGTALGTTGRLTGRLAIPAETAVLGVGSAALEGRAPTTDDFLHAAGLVVGLKGTAALARLATRLRSRGAEEDPMQIAIEELGEAKAAEVLQKLTEVQETPEAGTLTGFQEPPRTVQLSPEGREKLLSTYEGHIAAGRSDPTPSKAAFREAGVPPEIAEGTRRERAAYVESLKQEKPNAESEVQDVRRAEGEGLQQDVGRENQQRGGQAGAPPEEAQAVQVEQQPRFTSIQNAVVDRERAERGLPPAMEPAARGFGTVWNEAMRKVAERPETSETLVRELAEKPRAVEDIDDALLLHRQITLQNEFDKTARQLDVAKKAGDPAAIAQLEAAADMYLGKLSELYDINKAVGTATGRGLAARKMLADEDFSLVKMTYQKRTARAEGELPKEVADQVKEAHAKIADLQKKYDELVEKRNLEGAVESARRAVERFVRQSPSKRAEARKNVESAWKDFESKATGKLFSNPLDPELVGSAVNLARAYLNLGVATLEEFVKRITTRIGKEKAEKARETLAAAWTKATEAARPAPRGKLDSIGKISKYAQDLAEHFVAKGIRNRDDLIDNVHAELVKVLPDTTRRETMDAISGYGQFQPLSKDEIKVALRDLKGQMQQVGKIEDMEAKLAPRKTGPERRTPSEEERALIKEVEKLKKMGGFNVRDPEKELKSALAAFKTRTQNRINDYQERLAKRDFAPRKRTTTPLDKEAERLRFELEEAQSAFHKGLEKDRLARRKTGEKIYDTAKETLNLSRSVLTSFDVSAVRRQGGFLFNAHPLRAIKNIGPMMKAFSSKAETSRIAHQLSKRGNAALYKRSGLSLTNIDGRLSAQEEAFMSSFASKVPGVAGSERAYVTFLNLLRADSFDALVRTLSRTGKVTEAEAKLIANFVNVATGRGDLGKFQAVAVPAATVLFSPRYVLSRFQLLTGQPLRKGLLKGEGSARVRALIAKEYARSLAGTAVYYSLAASALYALAGPPGQDKQWNIELDPRSSDFAKIRIGKTRIDPLFGLQQVSVLMSRLIKGETKSLKGKVTPIRGEKIPYGGKDALRVEADFLRTKLSPVLATAVDVQQGKNVIGEPTTLGSVAKNLLIPISLRDIYSTMKEQGIPAGAALWIVSLFGDSLQTYEDRKKKNAA